MTFASPFMAGSCSSLGEPADSTPGRRDRSSRRLGRPAHAGANLAQQIGSALPAASAAGPDAERRGKVVHGARALFSAFADLALGDRVAEADVHATDYHLRNTLPATKIASVSARFHMVSCICIIKYVEMVLTVKMRTIIVRSHVALPASQGR